MGANTLTGLIQYIYDSADVVSRELTGMIPSVYLNPKAEMAAKDQDITYDVVPTMASVDITPAATPPALDTATVAPGTMKITKSKAVPFHWTGDDEAKVGREARRGITDNKFAQAMRTITNEIEADLAAAGHLGASRGYAAHATTPVTPFVTNLDELAQALKMMKDNGAPGVDMSCVLNTSAGANLRTLSHVAKANEAGTDSMIRQGILLDMYGIKLRESAAIVSTTAVGNNTGGYVVNGAHAKGATTITLKTGTGTVLAGDLITLGADTTTKYMVVTGCAAAGDIVIGAPGLQAAMAGDEALGMVGVCARNLVFERSAIHLLARLPKTPEGGDLAVDETVIVDPVSGLPFRVAMYKGYHANQFEVSMAWGVKVVKTPHVNIIAGQ